MYDFLSERQAYIEVDGETSELFDIILGCVQGNILGPIIFSIFMSTIDEIENDVTAYANDTYGIIILDNKDELSTAKEKIELHISWLRSSGMLVNDSKTDIMILHRTDETLRTININGHDIKTLKNINVLGMEFNQNLNWNIHAQKTINKCQRIFHGLKIMRKYFDKKRFNQLLTSYLYSRLYYGLEVWSYELLSYETKRKLDSFHYKCCRLAEGDFNNELSRIDLDLRSTRAKPSEYSDYVLGRMLIKAYTEDFNPLREYLETTMYKAQRKPNRLFFYDTSRIRIGKNRICNRVSDISKKIDFEWLNKKFTQTRQSLKKTFFNYLN